MLFLVAILVLTVYFHWKLIRPKVTAASNPKPLFQFSSKINWDKMAADATTARTKLRESLMLRTDEEAKATLIQMNAEDEHDAAIAAHHYPSEVTDYSASVTPQDSLIVFRKDFGEKNWEFHERKNAAAKIGAWIWLHTAIPYGMENVRKSFAIFRVDTPARWERYTYYHLHNEKTPTSYKYAPISYDAHDAAMAEKKYPTRKYIDSASISEKDKLTLHRTKAVDEWYDFMRLHANSTIGARIHFFEGTLRNDTPIRVVFAIHRVDNPERWEEQIYTFRMDERVPC